MSNECPTIQELADIVYEINNKLSETIYNSQGDVISRYELFEGQHLCEMVTDGDISCIKLLGMYVWNSEDDERSYLNSIDEEGEETPILNADGAEARTDMKSWLMAQVLGIHELVGALLKGKHHE